MFEPFTATLGLLSSGMGLLSAFGGKQPEGRLSPEMMDTSFSLMNNNQPHGDFLSQYMSYMGTPQSTPHMGSSFMFPSTYQNNPNGMLWDNSFFNSNTGFF
jgi:hypothetical protein